VPISSERLHQLLGLDEVELQVRFQQEEERVYTGRLYRPRPGRRSRRQRQPTYLFVRVLEEAVADGLGPLARGSSCAGRPATPAT